MQKKQQANLVIVALLVNFILHLGELLMYYTIDSQTLCNGDNEVEVKTALQLVILWLQNTA